MKLKILSIGKFSSSGTSNTCLHRTWALEKIADVTRIDSTLTHDVLKSRIINNLFVKYNLGLAFHDTYINKKIVRAISENNFDIVWIDKGVTIEGETLKYIKQRQPDCFIVGYSPDNMAERHNQSKLFLDSLFLYDFYVTTKSYTVNKLRDMGCKNVIFVNNAFEKSFHHPYELSIQEKSRLGGGVGFIGAWEEERCRSIVYLAQHGVAVKVWGGGRWKKYKGRYPLLAIEDKGLFSDDYNKALSAFDISLCFLRKMNHDLQTTRTMEIPACGSMLMAERTDEHSHLFKEDKEAVFFSSDEELLSKCKYYLAHKDERRKIAEAGHERCYKSDYSNDGMIYHVLNIVYNKKINSDENLIYLQK